MSERHPRAVKVPITYSARGSPPQKIQSPAPALRAQSILDPITDDSPSPSPSPSPGTAPSERANTPPSPLTYATATASPEPVGAPPFPYRMTPDPAGETPETAFIVQPTLTASQAADAVDPSSNVPEVPWMYGPFSISDTTWFASSEFVGERAKNEEVARKAKILASKLGAHGSGNEAERAIMKEEESESEGKGKRKQEGKGTRRSKRRRIN